MEPRPGPHDRVKYWGEEARGRGKDVILGPSINIKRSPLCGRNFEYMSEDPVLTAAQGVAYIQGVQESDVAACAKTLRGQQPGNRPIGR